MPIKNNYTVADLRALIESRIDDTAFADQVADVLKRFDGKTVTKRMATAVGKALPTYTVFYDTSIGMRHLYVWGNEIAYDFVTVFRCGCSTKYDDEIAREIKRCPPVVTLGRTGNPITFTEQLRFQNLANRRLNPKGF